MNRIFTLKRLFFGALILLAAGAALFFTATGRIDALLKNVVSKETHEALFLILFFILPLVGFPISVFLLLLGVKFDVITGILIMFAGTAFHLAVGFPAANSFLRPVIEKHLKKSGFGLPQFSRKGFVWPSTVFMAVPGLSYTLKNYILSLSGLPFRYYFSIGWLVQASMGIPVIIAGDAVRGRPILFFAALCAFFLMLYAVRRWFKKRRIRRMSGGSSTE